jgi:5-methylcytosine-specific restriction protein A
VEVKIATLKPRIQMLTQPKREYDRFRGSSTQRGYNYQWQQARAMFLVEHPLCVDCEKEGRVSPATEVDHIIPHRGDKSLFWKADNLQGLCKRHHSTKTARGE